MAKMRNGKKKILMLLIAILIIVLVVVIIMKVTQKEPVEEPIGEEENPVYDLPDTTYNEMEVRNVKMEYLTSNNETSISLQIVNNTAATIEYENIEILWINTDGTVIKRMPMFIENLAPGGQQAYEFVEKGDLTATSQIKIEKAQ